MKKTILTLAFGLASWFTYAQRPGPGLLEPANHTLLLIDQQAQLAIAVHSISVTELRSNVAIVTGASGIFHIPTVITLIKATNFAGPLIPEVTDVYPLPPVSEVPVEPAQGFLSHSNMNAWEDAAVHKAVAGKGRKKIVIAGLWTSVAATGPVLSALSEGYEVYVITDACGDISKEAHEQALLRMLQAGARPLTSLQYLLELQRDRSGQATAGAVRDLIVRYGGAVGLGVLYSREMLKN